MTKPHGDVLTEIALFANLGIIEAYGQELRVDRPIQPIP